MCPHLYLVFLLAASPPTDGPATAEDEEAPLGPPATMLEPHKEILISGESQGASPSERRLERATLEQLPMLSSDDVLRAMPGMHVSIHGGKGKAYQYFLRGFDAVHGADVAVTLEGVPLNEPSNIHGNGYLDLQFIPQDLIDSARLTPGLWRVQDGNFAVAGAARLSLGLSEPGGLGRVGLGSDLSLRGTAAWGPKGGDSGDFVIAEFEGGEGIGEARSYKQLRGGGGASWETGRGQARSFVLAYHGGFESPGVLREDDVEGGKIPFLGAYEVSQGGESSRVLGVTEWSVSQANRHTQVVTWLGWRDLTLKQNYTGYKRDPIFGDGVLQSHQSLQGGAKLSWNRVLSQTLSLRLGGQGDIDGFEQGEAAMDALGEAREVQFLAKGATLHGGGWGGISWQPFPTFYVEPGLRLDAFVLGLDPEVEEGSLGGEAQGWEWAWAPVLAPRLMAHFTPTASTALSLSYGRGMRSPEVRGIGEGARAPVTLTDSVELGVRQRLSSSLELRVAAFGTFISEELVFDHIEARFLTSGQTRRLGVDGSMEWAGERGARAVLDLTLTDGRYVASGEPIPYAPRFLGVGTLGYERALSKGSSIFGGLRGWALGPRPLTGGFTSTPSAVLDLTLGWRRGPWGGSMDVVNCLNSAYRDGEFYYASNWDPSSPESELPIRHFSAGTPRTLRLALERRF